MDRDFLEMSLPPYCRGRPQIGSLAADGQLPTVSNADALGDPKHLSPTMSDSKGSYGSFYWTESEILGGTGGPLHYSQHLIG